MIEAVTYVAASMLIGHDVVSAAALRITATQSMRAFMKPLLALLAFLRRENLLRLMAAIVALVVVGAVPASPSSRRTGRSQTRSGGPSSP